MTRVPIVSVCIPTFNRAHFLPDAVESVLRQTFADFELVISDNASTDGTAELLKRYMDPRVRVHANPHNLGLVGNFNRCLELARGQYVVLCCSDDYWRRDLLALCLEFMEQNPRLSYLQTGSVVVDENKERIGTVGLPLQPVTPGRAYFRRLLLEDLNAISFSSTLYRAELLRRIGGFDERLPNTQDLAAWGRLALHGDVGYLAEPLLFFRKHAANYHVLWDTPAYLKERVQLVDEIFDNWPETHDREMQNFRGEARRAIARLVVRSLLSQRLAGVSRKELLAQLMLSARRDVACPFTVQPAKTLAALAFTPGALPWVIRTFGTESRRRSHGQGVAHPADQAANVRGTTP